jgi:two-component system, response regulator
MRDSEIVEDDPADLELTLHALTRNHVANQMLQLEDGAEALDFLFLGGACLHRPPAVRPRLVLLDVKLPKVDGLQVLKEVKNNPASKAIAVILSTSSREERDLVASYRSGVNSYIPKPVNSAEFQEVIRPLGIYWPPLTEKPPAAAFEDS